MCGFVRFWLPFSLDFFSTFAMKLLFFCISFCFVFRRFLAASSLNFLFAISLQSTEYQPVFVPNMFLFCSVSLASLLLQAYIFSLQGTGFFSLRFTYFLRLRCGFVAEKTVFLFGLCSGFVRRRGGGLTCSSPVPRLFRAADFVCFKEAFLSVRPLFDTASASPPAAWSQATVSGSAGGKERAYRPASARCPGSTVP